MAFTFGGLAKLVIGVGTQNEPADKVVNGTVGVSYVEDLPNGGFVVELSDGSRWTMPPKAQASVNITYLYNQLANLS